jgi:plasmid stability protein
MGELVVREVEPALIAKLKERAEHHRRSIEDEHREILRGVLLGDDRDWSKMTFEEYLRRMPEVGVDEDFSRIEGSMRNADLVQ